MSHKSLKTDCLEIMFYSFAVELTIQQGLTKKQCKICNTKLIKLPLQKDHHYSTFKFKGQQTINISASYNSWNNRDMLWPPCLRGAQQLNQRRACICPAYLRGYKFPPYALSLRWQDWAPSNKQTDWVVGDLANSVTISLTNMGIVCSNGRYGAAVWMSLAIGQIPKQKALGGLWWKEKKITAWLGKNNCAGIVLLKWGLTARNIILIYDLILPAPSDGVIMHYELHRGSRPWAAEQLTTPQ